MARIRMIELLSEDQRVLSGREIVIGPAPDAGKARCGIEPLGREIGGTDLQRQRADAARSQPFLQRLQKRLCRTAAAQLRHDGQIHHIGLRQHELRADIARKCAVQPGSAAADETAAETTAEMQPVPATQAADPPSKDDPLLLLVSRAQPLAEDYAPELTQLHDWPYSIAAIAYEPLRQMLAAGRAEGLSFTVASAYRSTDSQRQLFDEDVEARVSEGMTEDEAREETARWTMPPGCSEHETGLAVDIVATDNQRLDDTQEQTPETIWLHENCWRFGFILRYPAGKEDVTGIDYESWHYRYVGIEAARYLTEQQLTLDEFWAS